jgi:hypothetical protein
MRATRPPDETLTERHPFVIALVTLLLVLTIGVAGGSGVAWLVVSAWHHTGL